MTTRAWDRAASLPVPAGTRPRPEVAALAADLPSVGDLFTFMRDAELRFDALRMRIEERRATTRGEDLRTIDVLLRHPGEARVTTAQPSLGTTASYEVWVSDGETIRTYAARRNLATDRPVRPRVRGVADGDDLPGMSRVYLPVTALPAESLPDVFVHPAGYCQNVLATGDCRVTGTIVVAGREAIVVESDHPRTVETVADRPDFAVRIAVDRGDGVILRLEEALGGRVTRDAIVTSYQPNAALPPDAFAFTIPAGATRLY